MLFASLSQSVSQSVGQSTQWDSFEQMICYFFQVEQHLCFGSNVFLKIFKVSSRFDRLPHSVYTIKTNLKTSHHINNRPYTNTQLQMTHTLFALWIGLIRNDSKLCDMRILYFEIIFKFSFHSIFCSMIVAKWTET